jgi:hypothetical protein
MNCVTLEIESGATQSHAISNKLEMIGLSTKIDIFVDWSTINTNISFGSLQNEKQSPQITFVSADS